MISKAANGFTGWFCVVPDLPGLRSPSLKSSRSRLDPTDNGPISVVPLGGRRAEVYRRR